jgi:alkylhydroperoxidase family enzyme
MPRIQPVDHASAQGPAKEYLDSIKAKLGATPNIFRTFAHSPAVGEFYANGSAALGKSTLSAALREQIALTVAGANKMQLLRLGPYRHRQKSRCFGF